MNYQVFFDNLILVIKVSVFCCFKSRNNMLHVVIKHIEGCVDIISDCQQNKLNSVQKKSQKASEFK